ncbi:Kae1-associated serine/threonine protein kinase [Candidatus Micrarchaeota archaeon]|nr:Kae1-associated serine/threonine protein kinase [Candidatus Micrarchaeota archaeon]MBD3417799.1 Kae1-associated serine/threonine protein kinase [Candidatus Micrarchaeota archaeon]
MESCSVRGIRGLYPIAVFHFRGLLMKGAEAVLVPDRFLGKKVLRKERRKKGYRIKEIDEKIRLGRTRREARLLHAAKLAEVSCPTVYEIGPDYLVIGRLRGRKLPGKGRELEKAGEILGKLHAAGILHGDFTPYNILVSPSGLQVIDFGLGSFSKKVEGRADDVITMLRGIGEKEQFLKGYRKFQGAGEVIARIEKIEARARYR